ncbi:pancreatic triacylglycerol lipase-like isoform X1 [Hylaeus volcanicus]|uniref:pancreatic triacylglycerol lipase-like isoform X1 n=2 Tax=Hylaeus volcanicus TaxID=313075 RepID=UPI0023B86DD8|nr:pancreatic triacylglycerol lipase-like isoform X1 [Hylaeus volcanicus]
MVSFIFMFVLIKLTLLSTACNNVLEKSASANTSLDSVGEISSINYRTNLTDFTFTLSNSSGFIDTRNESKSNQVDCFGLGKTLAATLEWFFMSKPNGTNALDVQFFLSSRKQSQRVQVMVGKQFGLEWTDFQIGRETIIIVHGFLSHGQESWISNLEQSFLQWNDVNVVVVDWSTGGNTWNYYKAAVNTRVVGYQIARFLGHIENATSIRNTSAADIWGPLHLVGHSLGAHICGFTAKELKRRQSKWKVARITGLDPAQPCFKNADSTVKLHKSDAPFVDIIHTNGKLLTEIGLGLPEPIGHVDFYPNGGKSQPGCVKIDSSYFEYLPIPLRVINKSICSHGRSYIYLTESLISDIKHNCTFWAHHWDLSYRSLAGIAEEPCNKNICTEMGINAVNYPQRGTFFVATSNGVPFCINNTRIIDEVIIQLEKDHENELDD